MVSDSDPVIAQCEKPLEGVFVVTPGVAPLGVTWMGRYPVEFHADIELRVSHVVV
jgi:hypothetical protein